MAEIARLLRARGHAVEVLERTSATAGRAPRAGAALLAGGLEPGEVERAVRAHRADVVHAHNIHPLFGAARAGRGPARRRAGRDAPAQLPPGLRDRDRLPRRRRVHALPWPQHAARGAPALPRQPPRGGRLRRGPRATAAADDPGGGPLRRAQRVRGAPPRGSGARHRARSRSCTTSSRDDGVRGGAAGRARRATRCSRGGSSRRREPTPRSWRRPPSGVPLAIAGAGPDAGAAASGSRAERDAPVTFLRPDPAGADGRSCARRRRSSLAPSRWDEPCPYSVIEAMAAGPAGAGVAARRAARDGGRGARAARSRRRTGGPRRCARCGTTTPSAPGAPAQALARARELFGEERFYSALMDVYERVADASSMARDPRAASCSACRSPLTDYERGDGRDGRHDRRGASAGYVCAIAGARA